MIAFIKRLLEPKELRFIMRPSDGVQTAKELPKKTPMGDTAAYKKTRDESGDLYVAVCDFCGGNCGQCGTSVGQGVPFDFDLMAKNGKWNQPGWGFRRGR